MRRRQEGGVAGATADIDDPLTVERRRLLDQQLRRREQLRGGLLVVADTPVNARPGLGVVACSWVVVIHQSSLCNTVTNRGLEP